MDAPPACAALYEEWVAFEEQAGAPPIEELGDHVVRVD